MQFFLLQSGANASIDLNLSTIPFMNLMAILIAIMLFISIVLFVIIRYVKKIGPFDLSKEHSIQTFVYNMNKEVDEIDNQLRMSIRSITTGLKTRLLNIFAEFRVCPVILIALSNSVPGPLYTSASNNHFTSVLMPENRDTYIENILKAIQDEYQATFNALYGAKCESNYQMPEWDAAVKERIQKFICEWCEAVITEVIKTSMKKIEIYKKYEMEFKDDSYRSGIIVSCIAKNEKYIAMLDRHGKSWS